MRIAYVITRGDSIGGAQVHVRDIAERVSHEGHEACVFLGGKGAFTAALTDAGIRFVSIKHMVQPVRPLRDCRAFFELTRKLARFKPDIISAHSSKAGILARLAGQLLGIPVLFTVHGWAFSEGLPKRRQCFSRALERATAPLAAKLICVSNYDRQLALRRKIAKPEQLITIHNGLRFSGDTPSSFAGDGPPTAIMVARFDHQKDHETLLRALQRLPEVSLDLVGDGPTLEETKAMAVSLGLSGRVHFLGQRSDVDRLLTNAQIAVLTSNYEGFPYSILEAMRAGLPVVASDVGGVSEAVDDGITGYLVPRGDVDLMHRRLADLAANHELRNRLGSAGRKRFLQLFGFEQMFDKTLSVYESVLVARATNASAAPRELR